MKQFIFFTIFAVSIFANRYYDPETGVFIAVDPAQQFFNAYGYGPGNPINGTDPTGSVWDYENMTLEELQMHESFLQNASGEAFSNYLAIHDAPEIFGHSMDPNLPGNMAFLYHDIPQVMQSINYRSINDLNPSFLAHEITHAYDFVIQAQSPYLPGTRVLNIMPELHAIGVQTSYMQKAGIPLSGISQYYHSNLGMSPYNQGRMLLDWGYSNYGYGIQK